MKTDNLRTNALSPDVYAWYLSYLTALDAKDIEAFGAFLDDNCVMYQNNMGPVEGKSAIMTGLKTYWESFGTLEHELLNIYGTDTAFMLEALNDYTRKDGKPVTLRAVALTDRNSEGKVTSFRFYTDTTPLFAP